MFVATLKTSRGRETISTLLNYEMYSCFSFVPFQNSSILRVQVLSLPTLHSHRAYEQSASHLQYEVFLFQL